jgi:nitroreductase
MTLSAWKIKSEKFPQKGDWKSKIKFLLNYAILAPSGHNSQPWKFKIETNTLSVYADLTRERKEVDPENRELYISVGCAVTNIEVAARHFGLMWEKDWWPKATEPTLVVVCRFVEGKKVWGQKAELLEAICQRSTFREKFEEKSLSLPDKQRLMEASNEGGVEIVWVNNSGKEKLADLIERAQKVWFRSRKLTEELKIWIKNDLRGLVTDKKKRDVINLSSFSSGLKDFLGRDFVDIDKKAKRDRERALGAPILGVVMTAKDHRKAWVEAGVLYQKMALEATTMGIQIGFFNSVAELPKKRAELALLLKKNRWPQLVLCGGYAKPASHSPRRVVEEVMI